MAQNIKWAVATVSLGKHETHTLERKFAAAAKHGFSGIELVHADLANYAKQKNISIFSAAEKVRKLSHDTGLELLSLSALKYYEGNLDTTLEVRLRQAREWIELARITGARHLQVPSQFLQNATSDMDILIPELQELADSAAVHNIIIAYEAVAFATFHALWQDSLRIVEAVNRSNFLMCLDSFHIHARIWGDAYAESGILPGADDALQQSMAEFLDTCPRDKIAYLQLSDASRFDPPLAKNSTLFQGLETEDARLVWSRYFRPFPLESPGYFPVAEIAQTWLIDYKWEGWVSLEGFLAETEQEKPGPEVMGQRAQRSIEQVLSRLRL